MLKHRRRRRPPLWRLGPRQSRGDGLRPLLHSHPLAHVSYRPGEAASE